MADNQELDQALPVRNGKIAKQQRVDERKNADIRSDAQGRSIATAVKPGFLRRARKEQRRLCQKKQPVWFLHSQAQIHSTLTSIEELFQAGYWTLPDKGFSARFLEPPCTRRVPELGESGVFAVFRFLVE